MIWYIITFVAGVWTGAILTVIFTSLVAANRDVEPEHDWSKWEYHLVDHPPHLGEDGTLLDGYRTVDAVRTCVRCGKMERKQVR